MSAEEESRHEEFLAQGTRDKVVLFWSKHAASVLRPLSINILREICMYLEGELTEVAAICQRKLRVLDVKKNTVKIFCLTRSFSTGTVFCFIEIGSLLCAGGWPEEHSAYQVNTASGNVTPLSPMTTARAWPGVYVDKLAAYFFGGNNPSICSCEKLTIRTKEWVALENMQYPRYSFTPCHFEGRLYLADLFMYHHVMETFDLSKEVFATVPVPLPIEIFANSVSFILDGELIILSDGSSRTKWRINSETAMRVDKCIKMTARPYSPCPPLYYGDKVYFSNFEKGQFACYHATSGKLQEVFKEREE